MGKDPVIQGNPPPTDIDLIKKLLADPPSWNCTRLFGELCKKWQWLDLNPDGQQLKDMACRTLLLKIEKMDQFQGQRSKKLIN
jgi:hypothetical protein